MEALPDVQVVVIGDGPSRVALEVSDKLTLHRLAGWARSRGVATVLLSHERLDGHLAPHVPRVVTPL